MAQNSTPAVMTGIRSERLPELVTDDIAKRLIQDFIRKHANKVPDFVQTYSGVMFRVAGASVFFKHGELTVEMGPFRVKDAAVWKQELTKLFTRAAGLIFQQQVRHIIASNYKIQQEQKSSNGALLLSTELWAGERLISSRVAILPNGRIAVFTDDGDDTMSREATDRLLSILREHKLAED